MKEITLKLYTINELSEEAREKAIEEYRNNNYEIFWQGELVDSLKSLIEHTDGLTLKDWSLGLNNSWIKVEFSKDETEELSGKRAFAWLENNLLYKLRIPYTGLNNKDSQRRKLAQYGQYYRAGMVKSCPFTGVCYDEDYIHYLKKSIKAGMTLKDAFNGLADEYQRILNNEWEGQNKEDYIIEHMEANDYQFLEDGTQY